jgi:hypothetical protein
MMGWIEEEEDLMARGAKRKEEDVIAQIVGWTKLDPIHKVGQLWEYLPTVTLDRYSPCFSDDKSPQGGNPGDPRGIAMESDMMKDGSPKGQYWR